MNPTLIPAFSPVERPLGAVFAGARLVAAGLFRIVCGLDEVDGTLLLMLVLLRILVNCAGVEDEEADGACEGRSKKPGLVTVLMFSPSVMFNP